MTDIVVSLGGIALKSMEVPDRIAFGGNQATKVHKLVGGNRVVDAMGRDDIPLEWSGRFFGADALSRAQAIDALRKAGKAVNLAWSALSYTVMITRFVADFEFISNLPYQITCEIITDDSSPAAQSDQTSIDDQTSADTGNLSDFSDGLPFF